MKFLWLATASLLVAGCASGPGTHPSSSGEIPHEEAAPGATSVVTRELTLQAMSYIGTPYVTGGNSPEKGFDCSGLVQYVYNRIAGVALPRTTEQMSALGASVRMSELRPGDLVFFNTLRRPFSHVGIYVGNQRFIHAPTSGGVVELVDMRRRYWQTRFDGGRRLNI